MKTVFRSLHVPWLLPCLVCACSLDDEPVSSIQEALTTSVTFDAPSPPGSSDSVVSGVFSGIDFGVNAWRWSGPYGGDPTNHVYNQSTSSLLASVRTRAQGR
jgi:hypothetical protein